MAIDTQSNEKQVVKLQKNLTSTNFYKSDLLTAKLGTTRISELRGKIGNNGKPFQELLNDYLNGL